ncbi:MAG: alcohol dehydrogenase catalytic domain-containing protein, partial [Caldilineaceae bacterium]|nr:alcohol dehydrogenase catalytic domain-containing protein [Caldilineaceae bacterium]
MRALIFRRHSVSLDVYEVVEDMPAPTPGPDEVKVRVRYAALNRLDDWVRRGWRGLDLQWPHIPCSDFSGTIVEFGEKVTGWRVGQRVAANPLFWCGDCLACQRGEQNRCKRLCLLGENVRGAACEFVCVPSRNLIEIPDGYDLAKAAAASLVYVTAWHSLIEAGHLRAGEGVLVVGAAAESMSLPRRSRSMRGAALCCRKFEPEGQQALDMGADWVHDRSRDPTGPRRL